MRCLKLDNATVKKILDELDSQKEQRASVRRRQGRRYPYRVRDLQVEFFVSRDAQEIHEVATRNIGRDGMSFLASNVIHVGTPCTVHLIGIQHNREDAPAKVTRCRYIEGTACAHVVDVAFEKPIDPASFAATAIRARVLLADASNMSRRLLGHLLEPLNIELVCVDNGVAAVQRALTDDFDLILIDPVLPKLDGVNAVRFLRKKGYLRPICAVSSKTTSADREACLQAGFEEFLPKPPRADALELVVQRTRPQPLVSSLLHKPDMRPLIDEFVLDLGQRATQLESAFATEDHEELMQIAMTLKADAGGFGFEMITQAAAAVERAVADEVPIGDLRSSLGRLVRLCQAARPATASTTAGYDDDLPTGDDALAPGAGGASYGAPGHGPPASGA